MMRKSRKVISLLLSLIMVMTTFVVAAPLLLVDADAAISIDGVTQERVVANYASTYDDYAVNYLNGASEPTDIVIPGLNPEQDYVIQGMTYYPARDWMLVTAYHNVDTDAGETTQSSKVFALDAATGEFVAMFSFLNPDGTVNTDHGGGIAVSEHNIYYSCGDKDTKIAYAPLSALANAELGAHTQIQLVESVDLLEVGSVTYDGKTAYTAYVCYDEGVLWTGNFYDLGAKLLGVTIAAADYNAPANDLYNSMVFGYKLAGNSSEEEWDHFKGKFQNLLHVANASGTSTSNGSTFTWNAYENGNNDSIVGSITAPTTLVSEFIGNFGTFNLTEGVNYTIEFTSTNINTDMYMWSPVGTHSDVKLSKQTTITQLEDGRFHFEMHFTAGLKPEGADSAWPETQSTDGSYTGTYTIRFDQDYIEAGETREFAITDIKVAQTNTYANGESVHDEGSVGSPSYALGLSNNLKDVQYATVDNGKLYLSRSYGSGAGNSLNFGFGESSHLTVADIDLSVPGTRDVTIKTASGNKTIKVHEISKFDDYDMMPMSEGLCVIEGNIFVTFEGASNKYLNESSGLTSIGNCEKPVDVIWQIDPYELMEVDVAEAEKSIHYEKVNSLSEIKDGAEYIIVHESKAKDPVTQKNYLYALNADGNFKGYKLSKSTSDIVMGYDGMIGHPISHYTIEEDVDTTKLYLEEPETDDIENVRWTISKNADGSYSIRTTESYFANYNNLYIDQDQITMAPGNSAYLSNMKIQESGNGEGGFWISNDQTYFLWCNEGINENYNKKINSFYINNSGANAIYAGISEIPGTFHCDALNLSGQNIIGESVSSENSYEDGVFNIYRRVVDEVASTYESRVYTDMGAELQADGTYTVTLETYAISPNHYQYVGERPTDYIIVADTSSSMAATGSTGIISYDGGLKVSSLSVEANTSDDNGQGVSGYGFTSPDEEIHYLHTDGKYYQVRLAVNTTELKKFAGIITSMRQLYWAYYIADDGLYYVLQSEGIEGGVAGGVWPGISATEFYYNVDNSIKYSEYSTKTSNSNRRDLVVFTGPHYRFANDAGEFTRLSTLQTAATGLVDAIAAQNTDNRIALVQYGSDSNTGFYNTSGTLTKTDYTNAFWSVSNKDAIKAKINAFTTSAQTDNSGIELEYAKNIITQSGNNYKVDGDRNVAVVFISDGMPGADSNDVTAANTAANTVVTKAKVLKDNGAFVYSAIVGNATLGDFNKKLYMECVSTKYAEAEGIHTELERGGQSVDGTRYSLNLATCTIDNFLYFGEQTNEQIVNNSAVGLENLDANSYLREKLTEAFLFPEDFDESRDLDVDLVPGVFDMIGRFSFDETNKVKQVNGATNNVHWTLSTANRTITLTNYDYAQEYISRYNDGNKLRVTIRGLVANKDAKIQNTSINDTADTGIYKNNYNLNNSVEFKELPTEYFNIPEYTYVLDYGFQMYDDDVNGTLCSVSDAPTKQDVDAYLAKEPETQKSANGLVEITDNSLDLIYTTTPDNFADSGYCLIKRDDGTYDWFEIKVVPASNVMFEEEYAVDGATGSATWKQDGTPLKTQQSLSGENDVYGHDTAYEINDHDYSNGSIYKTSVSATAKRSATKTFDFVGKGFDLISACGAGTGIMAVSVKDKDGKIVKGYIVDTYYNPGTDIVNIANSDGLVCQTPVISCTGLDHGTYTVEISAIYLSTANALTKSVTGTKSNGKLSATTGVPVNEAEASEMLASVGLDELASADLQLVWFDDNSILNGGSGAAGKLNRTARDGSTTTSLDCYIDGFRIYYPLGDDYSEYIDSEKGAIYYNVVDHIQKSGTTGDMDFNGIAYVEKNELPADPETQVAPTLSFATYEQFGPQDELYLKGNGTGALIVKVALNTPDSKVHLGLRAVTGEATVKIGDTTTGKAKDFTISGATEMYYDITDCVDAEDGIITITVQNTGTGVLAVNNIKVTGDATIAVVDEKDLSDAEAVIAEEPERAEVVNGVVTPVVEDVETDTDVDTDTDAGSGSSNLSFIEQIIAMIMELLSSIFQFLPVGEVM